MVIVDRCKRDISSLDVSDGVRINVVTWYAKDRLLVTSGLPRYGQSRSAQIARDSSCSNTSLQNMPKLGPN